MKIEALPTLFRTAGWRLKLLHGAPQTRLIWMTAGQARCILGSRMRGTGVHSLMLVPAGAPFALEPGAAIAGLMLTLPEDPPGLWPAESLLLRVRDNFRQSEIGGLLDAIQREQAGQRPLHEEAMRAYLPLIAIWLSRYLDAEESAPPDTPTSADLLCAAFLADLEASHRRGDSMALYARRLGITPTHLARVCKAQLGASAADLSAARTLWAARDLLETTDVPAKQIARSLGFGSGATFSRFVRARTGASPKALRKAARARPQAGQR
jgi:AraC family transcriptional activator of pobA